MINLDRSDDDGFVPAVLRSIADDLEAEGREIASEIAGLRAHLQAERAAHADTKAQLRPAEATIAGLRGMLRSQL